MGLSRLVALLAPVLLWARHVARRPALAGRRRASRLPGDAPWGPPVQRPGPWTPGTVGRARAAGLMLCGAIVGGAVLAGLLGFAVWLIALGIHHAASN